LGLDVGLSFIHAISGGKYMKFDMMTIQDLRREILRGNSPTDELLTLWGHKNHTVLELFVLLSEMQHYQAMVVLKPFGKCLCFVTVLFNVYHMVIGDLNLQTKGLMVGLYGLMV
jgi:interleukin-1 receptor-associated kinase 1